MAAFNSDNSIRLFFLINLFSITGLMLVSLPFILGGLQFVLMKILLMMAWHFTMTYVA